MSTLAGRQITPITHTLPKPYLLLRSTKEKSTTHEKKIYIKKSSSSGSSRLRGYVSSTAQDAISTRTQATNWTEKNIAARQAMGTTSQSSLPPNTPESSHTPKNWKSLPCLFFRCDNARAPLFFPDFLLFFLVVCCGVPPSVYFMPKITEFSIAWRNTRIDTVQLQIEQTRRTISAFPVAINNPHINHSERWLTSIVSCLPWCLCFCLCTITLHLFPWPYTSKYMPHHTTRRIIHKKTWGTFGRRDHNTQKKLPLRIWISVCDFLGPPSIESTTIVFALCTCCDN